MGMVNELSRPGRNPLRHMCCVNALIFFLTISHASALPIQNGQRETDAFYEQCLISIFVQADQLNLKSKLHSRSPASNRRLDQLDAYCQCHAQLMTKEEEIKKSNFYSYAFTDRSQLYASLDQCALNSLDNTLLVLSYKTFYQLYISPMILEQLTKRWPSAYVQVATELSYQNKLNCLNNLISGHCSRVTSLSMSFQCARDHFSQAEIPKNFDLACPQFSTDNSIAYVEDQPL